MVEEIACRARFDRGVSVLALDEGWEEIFGNNPAIGIGRVVFTTLVNRQDGGQVHKMVHRGRVESGDGQASQRMSYGDDGPVATQLGPHVVHIGLEGGDVFGSGRTAEIGGRVG